jgi:hypothetical protein
VPLGPRDILAPRFDTSLGRTPTGADEIGSVKLERSSHPSRFGPSDVNPRVNLVNRVNLTFWSGAGEMPGSELPRGALYHQRDPRMREADHPIRRPDQVRPRYDTKNKFEDSA